MLFKLLTVFFALCVAKSALFEDLDEPEGVEESVLLEQVDEPKSFSIISTSQRPSEFQYLENRVERLEFHLEIRAALSAINDSLKYLERTKHEIINEVDTKLKSFDENLRDFLREIKQEIVNETQQSLADTELKMKTQLETTKMEIVAKTKKLEGSDEIETIKKQLISLNDKIATYMEKQKDEYVPADCTEVQERVNVSGIYRIRPKSETFSVWCDMTTRGGGWVYVINRFDGSQNFFLNWTDYKQGFGNLSGEHWLGLEHLHQLTSNKPTELLFELVDWDSKKVHALYSNFKVASESDYYKITSIGNYTGTVGDSFNYHLNQGFSTVDHGNPPNKNDCPNFRSGAWWYDDCYHVHLTGSYIKNPTASSNFKSAIKWQSFHDFNYSLKEARMMIRQRKN